MAVFRIQERSFDAPLDPRENDAFVVRSVPRPYAVEFPVNPSPAETFTQLVASAGQPLLFVDRKVAERHFSKATALTQIPTLEFDAIEDNKNLASVLRLIDFLDANRATKSSMLFVAGGGITQDVAAFAAAMYKRGLPWSLVPTTLLAQGDSGIGSKAALNHASAKNQLGLFCAPRKVVIDTGFQRTLSQAERLSGLGEVFRLHVTGGPDFVDSYERTLPDYLGGSEEALQRLLAGALSAKRAVIEVDEFEVDLRRSLNYGHSFGHALEALANYRVPHGVAVTIGMLVENEIAVHRGILDRRERDRLLELSRALVSSEVRTELASVKLDGILGLLRSDKKAEGNTLKLVVPERIGHIRFIDLELTSPTESLLKDCLSAVVDAL